MLALLVPLAALTAALDSSLLSFSAEAGPAMIDIPAGTFAMGRPDELPGESDEVPVREVTLLAYRIGRYEFTNAECVAVLNWAHTNRRLQEQDGKPFSGRFGAVYLNGVLLKPVYDGRIAFSSDRFFVLMQDGLFMEDHPVIQVTWYGAVALCNWLSEMHGLDPAYDLNTWQRIEPATNGYRLPTEAEWERAAAWDAERRRSVTPELTPARANYAFNNPLEKLGMEEYPFTTPVGFFSGLNSDAEYAASPAGCFDMAGNVYEWCEDWFASYDAETQRNPLGPTEGDFKVVRGGGWSSNANACRPHNRGWSDPNMHFRTFGFRLAQSIP
jgi:formylglycine-generating enzyme